MKMRWTSMSLCIFFLCGAITGCSGEVKLDTIPVTGTVTFEGKPLAGAGVTFLPQSGRSASSETDASGKFQLTTYESGDGAVAGEHKVAITPPSGDVPEEIPEDYDYEKQGTTEAGNSLPTKYSDPETSGLTASVKEGDKNDFTFDLK